jgi:hypothetical protein
MVQLLVVGYVVVAFIFSLTVAAVVGEWGVALSINVYV